MTDEEKTKILWWVILALLGSVGVNQGINKYTPSVRHDAFTGRQGEELEHRIDTLESKCAVVEWRLDKIELIGSEHY